MLSILARQVNGKLGDRQMTDKITIQAADESSPEEFWVAFDEAYPEIADSVREGEAVLVDAAAWDAIQQLPGFDDGPVYAVETPGEVTEGGLVGSNGVYEVQTIKDGGYAVVNSETGQLHSQHGDRREAIRKAESLNQGGE